MCSKWELLRQASSWKSLLKHNGEFFTLREYASHKSLFGDFTHMLSKLSNLAANNRGRTNNTPERPSLASFNKVLDTTDDDVIYCRSTPRPGSSSKDPLLIDDDMYFVSLIVNYFNLRPNLPSKNRFYLSPKVLKLL